MYIWEPYGQILVIYAIQVLHGPNIGFFAHISPILVKTAERDFVWIFKNNYKNKF